MVSNFLYVVVEYSISQIYDKNIIIKQNITIILRRTIVLSQQYFVSFQTYQ